MEAFFDKHHAVCTSNSAKKSNIQSKKHFYRVGYEREMVPGLVLHIDQARQLRHI